VYDVPNPQKGNRLMADEITITKDGDGYCALIGADPMRGRMGCGASPSDALRDLATQIEIYGWRFQSGIEQKGKMPIFRLRFHPASTSKIQQLVAKTGIAVELAPDASSLRDSVRVEAEATGRNIFSFNLESINPSALAA
jgi:hypothetical protein